MKKTKNITMITILIVSLGLAVLFAWLFWSVLKGDNEINYAEYSKCLLYADHSNQKIDLTRQNNNQLVSATFKNFAHANGKIRQLSANDWAFIKRCENNMLYQANPKVVAAFNQKKTLSHFKTITDIVNGLTNNKIYPYQLEKMVLTLDYKEQAPFHNNLIDFANLFVSIFGAAIFKKLIYNLEIDNSIGQYSTVSNNQVLAFTKLKGNGNDLAQCLVFTEHSLQARMSKIQYQIGFHATATNISTIVHEIGHAISNYAWVWPNNRLRFNHNITPATGRCTPTKNKSLINIRGFMYSPNDSLVRYLGKQVGISNNAPFQQQLAAWAFIQSGYGRTGGNAELFAEGFAQWLLTPDDQKGLNWQILNDFYGTYFKNYYLI